MFDMNGDVIPVDVGSSVNPNGNNPPREGPGGRRDPGAADQVTRLSGCSLTRAAGAGSFERFSASFRDKLREKLARPDAAVLPALLRSESSMLEEAAGTRMFETKKQAAEKTIEKKDAKLKEINDILAEEINPTLTKLKEERSAYLEYQKIQRELEHLTKFYLEEK